DLFLDARYHGPSYSFNFAGLGNDTELQVDNIEYYRVRQERIFLYPAIKRRSEGPSGYITLGPSLDMARVEDTPNRFISNYDPTGNIFDRKRFLGGLLGLHYDNVDNVFSPHSGLRFESTVNWTTLLNGGDSFTGVRTKL